MKLMVMKVWEEGRDFVEVLLEDHDVTKVLTDDEIRSVVNPELQLRNIDLIFSRVFNS